MKLFLTAVAVLSLAARGQSVLFSDTFDRANSRNVDASLAGITDQTGASLPLDGVYLHGFVDPANLAGGPDADATNGGGAEIVGGRLELADGQGTSNVYVDHGFLNAEILSAGGFEVSLDVAGYSGVTAGQGGGFAIGMSAAQAADTGDAFDGNGSSTGTAKMTDGFGNAAGSGAVSDFWMVIRGDNSVVWGGIGDQAPFGSASVGAKVGTLSARFAFSDFSAGTSVAYEVFFNGNSIGSGIFPWDRSNENFIGLDARDGQAVSMDNFRVSTVQAAPVVATLSASEKVVPKESTEAPVTLAWAATNLPSSSSYEITASPAVVFPEGNATGPAAAGSGTVNVLVNGTLGDTEFLLRFLDGGQELATSTVIVRRQRTNVVLILLDDMGFSDWGCYGSEIRTPTIDSLASNGISYRNFYNTARCSTTRCALLSGLYTHQVGDPPGASLPPYREDNNVSIAELLSTTGYRRYMTGKWHSGTSDVRSPIGRGFQHIFGQKSAGNFPHNQVSGGNHDSFWNPGNFGFYSENSEVPEIDWTGSPFHQTTAIGDYALDFIDHHVSKDDGAPFFLYMPFNAQHWPINAPAEMADRYTDVGDPTPDGLTANGGDDGGDYYHYEVGWDQVRSERLAKQKAMGVLDSSTTLSPRSPTFNSDGTDNPAPNIIVDIPAWSSLSIDRRNDLARRMAVYAAMLEMVDQNIKKVVDHLRDASLLDDTMIILLADNGGNYEGGLYGRTFGQINAAPVTGATLANLGQSGTPDLRLGGGWANVNNTPFRLFKHYQHEGGIRTPCIIHWPNGITSPGRWIDDRGHLIDIMATISDVTDTPWPGTWPGRTLLPWEGLSLAPHFKPETVGEFPERSIGFEHESNRAWFKGKYKFVTKHFSYPDGSSPQNEFELYDLSIDPTELNNLAASEPAILAEMIDEWNAWAVHVGVPAGRLLLPPEPQVDPAPLGNDLFLDTFHRPNSLDHDGSAAGMSGSLVPGLGAGSTYFDSWEQGSTEIDGYALRMAAGVGMTETAVMHNFIDPAILSAGGFSAQIQIDTIASAGGDEANRYAGIAIGLTATEAQASNDIGTAGPPRSFRGTPGVVSGSADCFVEVDQNGNVKCWIGGGLVATIPVGKTSGTLLVSCETGSFAAGAPAIVRVFLDGALVDLDSASAETGRVFNWSSSNQNYIGLSARASDYVALDNFVIRTLPLSSGLSSQYANEAGLSGGDSAPGSDPDGDGDDNFMEWLKAGNPDGSDVGRKLLSVSPSEDGSFRFSYAYVNDAEAIGLRYTFRYSTDLAGDVESWAEFTPDVISSQPLGDRHEVRLASLPDSLPAGSGRLFIVVDVK